MEIAKLQVTETSVKLITQRRTIPAGLIGGYITVEYADDLWDGLTKTVVFRADSGLSHDRSDVTKDVVTNDSRVMVPPEVLARPGWDLKVGFYGTGGDGTLAIPTITKEIGTVVEAADPSGDETTNPTLPVWAQLAERVDNLEQNGGGGSGGGTGGSMEGAVLCTVQNLTEAQQEQARKNIGVDAYIEEVFLGGAW